VKASGDLHGGHYTDAIIAQFTGKGTGACYNPTKILLALRQLVRWSSRRALTNHRTRLWCESCQKLCPVVDYRPLANVAVLACNSQRAVSCQTPEEYNDLITRAESLKIQVVRNAELGGYEAVEVGAT
jgi:hypothetical protein